MPTEFQRVTEDILFNMENVFVFIDDIIIVRKLDNSKVKLNQEKI